MRIRNTTLAALCLAFVSVVAYSAAGDRYFSNPTSNKDVVIQVNKAGVTTDAVKAVGATGAVTLGPSTGNVSHQVIGKEAVVGTDTGEGLRFNFLNAAGGNKAALLVGGFSPSANNAYAWLGTYENGVGPAAMKFASYTTEVGGYSKTGAWTLGHAGLTGKHIIRNGSSTASQPVLTIIKDNLAQNTNSNIYMSFEAASASDDGYLQTNGSAVFTVTDVSDRRLKKNIRDATYGLDTIMALRPVLFDWKSGPQDVKGFIAQEVKSVLPESVTVIDKSVSGGFKDSHFLEMQTMIPVLVKAVQELSAENAALKFRLTALEADRKY